MKASPHPERRSSPGRRLLPWLGLVAVVGVGGFFLFRGFFARAELPATAFYEVQRGDFVVSVVEGGTVEAVNEVVIRNEVEGTSRIIYIVREGTFVNKGDLLVELDSAQAQDQVNQQEINYEKARFALLQAEAQLEIQRSLTNSEIDAAALRHRLAQLDYDRYMRGQSVVDLIEATNRLVEVEAQLAVNLDTYMWTTNLAASGYETQQRADSDRLSLIRQQNQLTVVTNQLWILKEFTQRKERETFASNLREAGNDLQRVIAQAERRIAQYEADLLTQSNTLTLSFNKLQRDRRNLDGCRILAPQDGLVVYPTAEGRFSSESLIEEGATVRNRQELIKLPDTSRMKVTIRVHESFVNMVERGQTAFVVLDSMPDQRFRAVVDRVGLLPDLQARFGNPNLKVYRTEVVILDPLPDVKPGVSAKAEIIVSRIANALSVPIQAVTTLNGRQVCYVQRGGTRTEPVPVEVGLFNTKFIEITSGLQAGDRVLLAPPFDTQERHLEATLLAEGEVADLPATPAGTARPAAQPAARALPDAAGQAAGRPDTFGAGPGPGAAASGREGMAGPGGAAGAGGMNMEAMLRQFDKDGDGQLNEEERQAMREEFGRRMGQGGMGGQGGQGFEPGMGRGNRGGAGGEGGGGNRGAGGGEVGGGGGARGGGGGAGMPGGGGGRTAPRPE